MNLPIPPELAVEVAPFEVELLDAESPAIPRWRIESDGEAEWSLRHLAEAQMSVSTVEEQAAEWRRRIDEYVDNAVKPMRRRAEFFRVHLEDYALRVREASGDEIKAVRLPSGDVQTHASAQRVEVWDAEGFTLWAGDHADDPMVRTKHELAKAEAKACVVIDREHYADRHLATLACGAELVEVTEPGYTLEEWGGLDIACPDEDCPRERCPIAEVRVEEVTRAAAWHKATGERLEWAAVISPTVTAKVKL